MRSFFVFIAADCELFCVYKEDFDEILRETMETKHEDIKSAIRRFEYFKNFTNEKVGFGSYFIRSKFNINLQ